MENNRKLAKMALMLTDVSKRARPSERTGIMDGRANPIPELGDTVAADLLETVSRAFSRSWLESSYGNPIQQLWRREDTFATSELMILGQAIKTMSAKHREWVERRVLAAKSRKPGSRIGDIFELLGLAMLSCADQIVVPARENQPGFDGQVRGCLETPSGRLSMG